jgi:photosystem II stability/assembly factor-like uncharacterized protein
MAIDSDGTIYVGTGPRLFRSTDGGTTWQGSSQLESGWSSITHLLVDAHHQVYAVLRDILICRSTDRGKNWTTPKTLPTYSLSAIVGDSHGTLFATGFSEGSDLMKSVDGTTWQRLSTPFEPMSIYLTCATIDRDDNIYIAGNGNSYKPLIYRSSDGGQSWEIISPPVDSGLVTSIHADNREGLYLRGPFGIYRTIDTGRQWRRIFDGPTNDFKLDHRGRLYAIVDSGVAESTDRGDSWRLMFQNATDVAFNSFAVDSSGTIVAPAGGGLFRRSREISSWKEITDGIYSSVRCITSDSTGRTFAGTTGAGLFYSDNGGEQWLRTGQAILPDTVSSILAFPDGLVLAGTIRGLYVSEDRGLTWQLDSARVRLGEGWDREVQTLVGTSKGVIYSTDYYAWIHKSTDRGVTWKRYENDRPSIMAVAPNDDIYMDSFYGWIYRSTDGGVTWKEGPRLGSLSIIKATITGYLYCMTLDSLVRSSDRGETWQKVLGGTYSNNGLTIIESDSVGNVYMATDKRGYARGLFRSTDNGSNWEPFNDGLPVLDVTAIHAPPDHHLLAAGNGFGVLRTSSATTVSVSERRLERDLLLIENHPNPFPTTTAISYTLPRSVPVQITIIDSRGEIVVTLIDAWQESGDHRIEFDAGSLPTGIYLCRLEAGEESNTIRVTVVR